MGAESNGPTAGGGRAGDKEQGALASTTRASGQKPNGATPPGEHTVAHRLSSDDYARLCQTWRGGWPASPTRNGRTGTSGVTAIAARCG